MHFASLFEGSAIWKKTLGSVRKIIFQQKPASSMDTSASRRAPLVLSCLKTLFEKAHDGIPLEDAIQSLPAFSSSM
jgi:hypothetical protein